MLSFGTEFAQIFQKLRIVKVTIHRLVTLSFFAHFCKKLTFCFASLDFNYGNFVMKLNEVVVKIATYMFWKIGNWLKIKSFLAKKPKNIFGKIEKHAISILNFQFIFKIQGRKKTLNLCVPPLSRSFQR